MTDAVVPIDLHSLECRILRALHQCEGGLWLLDLAGRFKMRPSQLMPTMKALKRRGYIAYYYSRDRDDERVILRIAGRGYFAEIQPIPLLEPETP